MASSFSWVGIIPFDVFSYCTIKMAIVHIVVVAVVVVPFLVVVMMSMSAMELEYDDSLAFDDFSIRKIVDCGTKDYHNCNDHYKVVVTPIAADSLFSVGWLS